MYSNETASRIVSERNRLGLTTAQLAVMLDISEAQQIAIEAGDFSSCPTYYEHAMKRAGADPLFIHGQCSQPAAQRSDLLFGDESFASALHLLRRSQQAIEAFFGEGASKSSPQLVAALMNATLQERYSLGAGTWEEFAEKIAYAIAGGASEIAEALLPDDE